MRYFPAKRLLYRKPLFSWDEIKPLLNPLDITRILERENIRTAMYVATPEFVLRYERKSKEGTLTDRDLQKMAQYLIRMSTRSTPFGLFSGVGVGSIEEGDLFPQSSELKVKSHWIKSPALQHFENEIDKKANSRYLQKWIINPSLIFIGDSIRIYGIDRHQKAPKYDVQRFKYPSSVKKLCAQFDDVFELPEAVQFLRSKYRTKRNTAETFLFQLVEAGVIIPADREPLLASGHFTDQSVTKEELEACFSHYKSKLPFGTLPWVVNSFLENPMSLSQKNALKLLSACEKVMSLISRNLIADENSLPARLKYFLQLNSPHSPFPVAALTERMLMDIEVPRNPDVVTEQKQLQDFLGKKLSGFPIGSGSTWNLTNQDLQDLRSMSPKKEGLVAAPPAMSILAVISRIGENQVLIPHFACRGSASGYHARFYNLSPQIQDLAHEIQDFEQRSNVRSLTVDLEYKASNLNKQNVIARKSHFSAYIDMVGSSSSKQKRIPLSDVYAYLDSSGELKYKSNRYGIDLDIMYTHLYLGDRDDHFFYRLFSRYWRTHLIRPLWHWNRLSSMFSFFPRVCLGDVVVGRATWILRKQHPPAAPLRDQLETQLKNFSVPNLIWMVEADNRLYLDLSMPVCKDILLRQFTLKPDLWLEEVVGEEIHEKLEVVVTGFLKGSANEGIKAVAPSNPPSAALQPLDARLLPGPLFSYYKLYCDVPDFDFILEKFRKHLFSKKLCWFYVKFRDTSSHLRLRIFYQSASEKKIFNLKIEKLIREMLLSRLVHRVDQSVYERELGRYGGLRGVIFFEKLSCFDSKRILAIQHYLTRNEIPKTRSCISSVSIELIHYWLDFFLTENFEKMEFCQKFARGERDSKKARFSVISEISGIPGLRIDSESRSLAKDFFSISKNWGRAQIQDFLHSTIHMSLNRWCFPLEKNQERYFFYCALSRYLHDKKA